MTVADEV